MDLKELGQIEEACIEILHPATEKPLGIRIWVVGVDSELHRANERKIANKRLARAMKRSGKTRVTAEELYDEATELLAADTRRWEGVEESGQAIPFSLEAAKDLYARYPWIRKQVDEGVADRELFFKS